MITKGVSVNREEKEIKDKAEGGGVSKEDLEGAVLKVRGKSAKWCPRSHKSQGQTVVYTSQTESCLPYQMGYFATKARPLERARTLESLIAELYRQTFAN